ncbi:MAG: choice-of-anchor Q domain-containing protein, partial [Candidatus Nitrosopolaris sp.]
MQSHRRSGSRRHFPARGAVGGQQRERRRHRHHHFAPSLAGTTIALTERFAPITRSQITLAGLTSNGQPNITLDATNASNPGAILFIAASNFTMTGMNITNLPANFNAMQIGGFGYNLVGQMVSSPGKTCCFQINGNAFSNGSDSGNGSMGIFVPPQNNEETIASLTIANNSFSQLFEAINIGGGSLTQSGTNIQDVMIFGNSFSQMTSTGTSALEVGSEGTNNTIQRVEVVQNTFTGNFQGFVIDIGGASSGNLIKNVIIARNVFSGNLGALGIVAGVNSDTDNNTVMNAQIVDNLVDLTGYQGQGAVTIQITDNQSGGSNNKVTSVSFANDTIYNGTSLAPPGWGVWVTSSGGVTGVSIENTIFWGNESSPPLNGITSPAQVSYSIIDQSGFTGTNQNINSDPLFVNSSSGNFELQSGSPALHAGTSAGAPAIDIDCQPRNSPPSIGAYEFEGPDICPATLDPELTDSHDFNGDGMSDILWRQGGSGALAMWLMSGSQLLS